jgi:hypothetical protein
VTKLLFAGYRDEGDKTQPYQVRTSCGHIVTRRMRPSTAGVPYTPETVIEAPNGRPCDECEPRLLAEQEAAHAKFITDNFAALVRAIEQAGLPPATVDEFMWMTESPKGVHQYKHRDTRNYAFLRGAESPEDCILALNHARSMTEKWPDRPRLAWELVTLSWTEVTA